jgi:hypothetical protein
MHSARGVSSRFPMLSTLTGLISKQSNGSRVRVAATRPREHVCDAPRGATPDVRARLAQTKSERHRLDPKVTDRALDLSVPEKQLDRSKIASLAIDLRRLGAPHRMRAISAAVHPGALDPAARDARVLVRCHVSLIMDSARKDVGARSAGRALNQSCSEARVCSVISNCTGRPVLRWMIVARSLTCPPTAMSSTLGDP